MKYFLVLVVFGMIGMVHAQEQNENIRIEDPTFTRQNLQTGETLSNPHIVIIIESLGAVLIVFFIIFYAIKKKSKKISK